MRGDWMEVGALSHVVTAGVDLALVRTSEASARGADAAVWREPREVSCRKRGEAGWGGGGDSARGAACRKFSRAANPREGERVGGRGDDERSRSVWQTAA